MKHPLYARRGYCADIARKAGLTEYAIKNGMALLPKYKILGSVRAQYKVSEFLEAFQLTAPASSAKS
jgi:hypothetical protein